MAQTTSIIVTGLKSASQFVDQFAVSLFTDPAATHLYSMQVSAAVWNGTNAVQSTPITFSNLPVNTTYYAAAASVCTISGAATYGSVYAINTSTSTAPVITFAGGVNPTTSGAVYVLTPTTLSTDIDHYEATWVINDSTTTPLPTDNPTTGALRLLTGTNAFNFFVGALPGQVIRAWVRGVNTAGLKSSWFYLQPYTVKDTWSGNTTGTVLDNTVMGTGGVSIIANNSGKLGWGMSPGNTTMSINGVQALSLYSPVEPEFWLSNPNGQNYYNFSNTSGATGTGNATTGAIPLWVTQNNNFGYSAFPSYAFQVNAANQAYVTGNANAAWVLNSTGAGSNGQFYSMGNNAGAWALQNTGIGATNMTLLNNNMFGFNRTPSTTYDFNQGAGDYPHIVGTGPVGLFYATSASSSLTSWLTYAGTSGELGALATDTGVFETLMLSSPKSAGWYGTYPNGNFFTLSGNDFINSNSLIASSFRLPSVNNTYVFNGNPISQHGTTTQIDIRASTGQFGSGTVVYNSGTVNPGSYGTFFIYADDPTYSGGAVTYHYTSTASVLSADDHRVYFGTIITTSSGVASTASGGTVLYVDSSGEGGSVNSQVTAAGGSNITYSITWKTYNVPAGHSVELRFNGSAIFSAPANTTTTNSYTTTANNAIFSVWDTTSGKQLA